MKVSPVGERSGLTPHVGSQGGPGLRVGCEEVPSSSQAQVPIAGGGSGVGGSK